MRLFKAPEKKEHRFCGNCGCRMTTAYVGRPVSYDRQTGEALYPDSATVVCCSNLPGYHERAWGAFNLALKCDGWYDYHKAGGR